MADVPASTSTTASIGVGGLVQGSLEVAGDHDWYAINLVAGQQITISLFGSGSNPVPDPYLDVMDASGRAIAGAWNDDSGSALDSKLVFTATTTGTYYIDAGGFDSSSVDWDPANATPNNFGSYTLSVQPYTPPPVWTYDQIANQLTTGYWNAQGGNPGHHFNVTQGGTITVNYSSLTAAEQNLAITALAEWSDIIGVTFTPVTAGGQIQFTNADDPSTDGPDAYTEWLNTYARVDISSTWVTGDGTRTNPGYGTSLNSYSFQTYLHEIGHALGLGHAGNYNNTADYTQDALYANDAWSTTIMSYFDQSDNSYFAGQGFTKQLVLTPMVADIVAMQKLYGLSTTTRTGDTTYGFNSTAGRDVLNASLFPSAAYTLFDSGGTDTLNYSGYSNNQLINLNPETFSNIGTGVGNVSIARGTIIENAIGGSGNDRLIGNDYANVLTGGAGADFLTGGAGADTFRDSMTGLLNDTITDFGAGDKIVFTDSTLSTFTFNLSGTSLIYNGFTLKLGSVPSGTITASAAAGGGVQLTLATKFDAASHAGDFNGDGRADVLWQNDSGLISSWMGQLNGSFVSNSTMARVDATWHVAGTGDFNGDHRDDVVWRNDNGAFSEWLSQADGSFLNNYAVAGSTVSNSWHVVGTGDFNGDTRDDVLWQNDSGLITDWMGQLNGAFASNSAMARIDASWHVVGTGDFNGDHRDDIIWRNDNGAFSEWLGQGDGSFLNNFAAAGAQVSNSWHVVGTGDFNGDGRNDVLWQNDSGFISDWMGQLNGGFVSNSAMSRADSGWHVVGTGDFNGDHRDDIIWRNDNGTFSEWLGQADGSFLNNHANAGVSVSTSWHVEPSASLFS